jgi:hypothetical protein
MSKELDQVYVEFHNRAADIFLQTCSDFARASKTVDRKVEEYLFRQVKEKHVNTLKQRLEIAAEPLIRQYRQHGQLRELDQSLQQIINGYLHRFVLETRDI